MYTRHKPLMTDTLELLIKGRLKDTVFPYVGEMKLAERWACSCRGPRGEPREAVGSNLGLLNFLPVHIDLYRCDVIRGKSRH